MATIPNSGREDAYTNTPVAVEQPSTLQVVTYTIWDTVCSKTFAIGAMVGAALMYAGIRVAQAYLSEDGGQETDRPF
jgi:hypothetical protein